MKGGVLAPDMVNMVPSGDQVTLVFPPEGTLAGSGSNSKVVDPVLS